MLRVALLLMRPELDDATSVEMFLDSLHVESKKSMELYNQEEEKKRRREAEEQVTRKREQGADKKQKDEEVEARARAAVMLHVCVRACMWVGGW